MKLYPGQEMIQEIIEFRGVEISVEATYLPPAREVYSSSMPANPPEHGEIDDHKFFIDGKDVTDLLEEQQEDILEVAVYHHEKLMGVVA